MASDLGRRLVEVGLVTRGLLADVRAGAPAHEGALVAELAGRGVAEDGLAGFFVAEGFGPLMTREDLTGAEANALGRIPGSMAAELLAMPIHMSPAGLVIAMAAPTCTHSMAELSRAADVRVLAAVARVSDLRHALALAYPGGRPSERPLARESEPPVLELVRRKDKSTGYLGSTKGAERVGARAVVGPGLMAEDSDSVVPLVRTKPVTAAKPAKPTQIAQIALRKSPGAARGLGGLVDVSHAASGSRGGPPKPGARALRPPARLRARASASSPPRGERRAVPPPPPKGARSKPPIAPEPTEELELDALVLAVDADLAAADPDLPAPRERDSKPAARATLAPPRRSKRASAPSAEPAEPLPVDDAPQSDDPSAAASEPSAARSNDVTAQPVEDAVRGLHDDVSTTEPYDDSGAGLKDERTDHGTGAVTSEADAGLTDERTDHGERETGALDGHAGLIDERTDHGAGEPGAIVGDAGLIDERTDHGVGATGAFEEAVDVGRAAPPSEAPVRATTADPGDGPAPADDPGARFEKVITRNFERLRRADEGPMVAVGEGTARATWAKPTGDERSGKWTSGRALISPLGVPVPGPTEPEAPGAEPAVVERPPSDPPDSLAAAVIVGVSERLADPPPAAPTDEELPPELSVGSLRPAPTSGKSIIPPNEDRWDIESPENQVDPAKLTRVKTFSRKEVSEPRRLALARAESANPPPPSAVPPRDVSIPAAPPRVPDVGRAISSIRAAGDRDEIVKLACEAASQVCRASVLLALRKGVLKGWEGRGADVSVDAVRNLWIPTSTPSMFRDVVKSKTPYLGPPGTSAADGLFRAALGSRGADVALQPIVVGGKLVGILAADDVRHGPRGVEKLEELALAVGDAFERIILRSKR
ncbi:MAG: hypothetical protein AB7S26_26775 [Sandaracinaceae bacterium]